MKLNLAPLAKIQEKLDVKEIYKDIPSSRLIIAPYKKRVHSRIIGMKNINEESGT